MANRFQRTIRDAAGNVAAAVAVTVTDPVSGSPVSIFTDEALTVAKANPGVTDANGRFDFWAANTANLVDVTAGEGVSAYTLKNVLIGVPQSQPYANRAAAVAASKFPGQLRFEVIAPDGSILRYVEDAATSTPALTMADGTKLVPDGDAYPDHWAENTTPGTTDMTVAIQAAIDYVKSAAGSAAVYTGGVVRFFAAEYFVSDTIAIDGNGVKLYGAPLKTVLTRSGNYGDTIHIGGQNPSRVFYTSIVGFVFESTGVTTSGAHVHIEGGDRGELSDCHFYNGFVSIHLQGVAQWVFSKLYGVYSNLFGGSLTGRRHILVTRADAGYPYRDVGDVFFSDFNLRTAGPNPFVEYCAEIQNCDGLWFDNGHFGGGSAANILVNAANADQSVSLLFFDNTMFDANHGDGVVFSGSSSVTKNVYFNGCNAKGGAFGVRGFYVSPSATVRNVQWNGGFITEYNNQGVLINSASASGFHFSNLVVRGNSYTTPNSQAGLQIAAGSNIRVESCVIGGGNVNPTSLYHSYGIVIASGVSNVSVNNTDLRYNATAPSLVSGGASNVSFTDVTSDRGSGIASASTIDPARDLTFFIVTGTTAINNMTLRPAGSVVSLLFQGAVTIGGAGNIKTSGFTSIANQVLHLVSDGTNWYPLSIGARQSDFVADATTGSAAEINAIRDALVAAGIMMAS